jgi:uncharacterized membrane protein
VRASVVAFLVGEALALVGIGLWSVALALVVAGVQLAAVGLLRESRTARQPAKEKKARSVGRHHQATARRFLNRARPVLKLVREVAS